MPVEKNKIFFSSYEGKQYSCNPKCVFQYLREENRNLIYVWEYNLTNIPDDLSKNIIIVRHNSFSYFLHLLTSKYIITNSGISASISLRKKQICVNTWHGGGAYKKVGALIPENVNGTSNKELKIMAKQTRYFLSSSHEFTKIMIPSTMVEEHKFLRIGMPRNDVFFNPFLMEQKTYNAQKILKLDTKSKVVLFAPTYRGESGERQYTTLFPDVNLLLKELTKRFGGQWKFVYRAHYYKEIEEQYPNVINASQYPDMQDLLCLADVLITDYSSSIWDYSFTFRPCFLFVPDLKEYINERGGFYSDISTWPGIVSTNDTELRENISHFEKNPYQKKIYIHHESLGSYDMGVATKKLVDILQIK